MKDPAKKGTILVAVFMAIVLCIDVYEFFFTAENKISTSFSIVGALLALYYGFFGYAKPNGNLLKFLFIAYGVAIGLYGVFRSGKYLPTAYFYFLCAVIVVYMSGRLDRLVPNTFLFAAAFILVFAGYVMKCTLRGEPFLSALRLADELYILIALFAFYSLRYKAHKAAGAEETAEITA